MKPNDPIIIPDQLWTKELIHEQMEDTKGANQFTAADISDEDAIWWVKREDHFRFEAIQNGEDYYGRKVDEINRNIIQRTMRSLGMGK